MIAVDLVECGPCEVARDPTGAQFLLSAALPVASRVHAACQLPCEPFVVEVSVSRKALERFLGDAPGDTPCGELRLELGDRLLLRRERAQDEESRTSPGKCVLGSGAPGVVDLVAIG